jgi:hypothetical protein
VTDVDGAADRVRLLAIVRRLVAAQYSSDEALEADASAFTAAVPHPRAMNLIFYWADEFEHQPSPEEIVDRALAYPAIQLPGGRPPVE